MKPGPEFFFRNLLTSFMVMLLAGYLLLYAFPLLRVQYFFGPAEDGAVALKKHDLPRARALFDEAIHRHPQDADVYGYIVGKCIEANSPSLAVTYGEEGVAACAKSDASDRASLFVSLSSAYAAAEPAHPQTRAIEAARQGLKLAPQDPVVLNAVGYVLADNDQSLDEADRYVSRSLSLLTKNGSDPDEPDISEVYDSYGWVQYKKGDYAQAVEALDQAVNGMPDDASPGVAKILYYHLGAALRKSGLTDRARQVLQIALHYDPAFTEAQRELEALPPPTPKPHDAHALPSNTSAPARPSVSGTATSGASNAPSSIPEDINSRPRVLTAKPNKPAAAAVTPH